MAKQYSDRKQFSIAFVSPVPNSNDQIKWTKVNFVLPPNTNIPTFRELHNTFLALDTDSFKEVITVMGLDPYSTSTSDGVTDTRYQDLVLQSTLIYYIK